MAFHIARAGERSYLLANVGIDGFAEFMFFSYVSLPITHVRI